MRCPRCGSLLTPDPFRMDTLLCDQCGEVEIDGEGAVVGGSFYELDDGAGGDLYDRGEEAGIGDFEDLTGGEERFGRWVDDEE